MITKEHNSNKKCLFYVSDYHLEMILLPYILENKNKFKTIIFTENNLEKSIDMLLTKINLKKEDKETIKNIDWNYNDSLKFEQIENNKDSRLNIIINGSINYIKMINKRIEQIISINNKKEMEIEIVDCFHLENLDIDISEISKDYKSVLNTKKI